jgi:hypothetical protein
LLYEVHHESPKLRFRAFPFPTFEKAPLFIAYDAIAGKAKICGGNQRGGVGWVCLIFSGRGSAAGYGTLQYFVSGP